MADWKAEAPVDRLQATLAVSDVPLKAAEASDRSDFNAPVSVHLHFVGLSASLRLRMSNLAYGENEDSQGWQGDEITEDECSITRTRIRSSRVEVEGDVPGQWHSSL
eukprot:766932-Hanusia_phi.AAC.10